MGETSVGLLLDFPQGKKPHGQVEKTNQDDTQREQACALLAESVQKARLRLSHRPRTSWLPAEKRLENTMLVANQLIANPDTRIEDLLNYLADIEASAQLLACPGTRTIGAYLNDFHDVTDDNANGGDTPGLCMDAPQLEEWTDDFTPINEAKQLAQVAVEAEALAEAQREVAALVDHASNTFESTEKHLGDAIDESHGAVRELGAVAKTDVAGWTWKASFGGAVVGATVGGCVAGPLGAAVGAGASATIGAIGGKAAKNHHNQVVDRIMTSAEMRKNRS